MNVSKMNEAESRSPNPVEKSVDSFLTYLRDTNEIIAYRFHKRVSIDRLQQLWREQNGRCAVSGMAMTHKLHDLCAISIDLTGSHPDHHNHIQLVCEWVRRAKGWASNSEIRAVLSMFKAFKDESYPLIVAEHLLMDHIAAIIRRGGLCPCNYLSNELAVYYIVDHHGVNVASHRTNVVELRGYVHFQGGDVTIKRANHQQLVVDLNDPNYYVTILKFFGIDDYQFQIFADHHVFIDL